MHFAVSDSGNHLRSGKPLDIVSSMESITGRWRIGSDQAGAPLAQLPKRAPGGPRGARSERNGNHMVGLGPTGAANQAFQFFYSAYR